MIPKFPDFKNLEVGDRALVEAHTSRFDPYSDFNFTSLYTWDTAGERMISELNDNLVVRFTDYSTHEPFLSFLGENEREKTSHALLEYANTKGLPPLLKLMPEVSIQNLHSPALRIGEDRNNFDYIYSVPALSRMEGGELKPRRNFINRFTREHPDAYVEVIDLALKDAQASILAVLEIWENNKIEEQKKYELEHERTALRRLFETAASHKLFATGVFLDGSLRGFSIEELLPNEYCIGHFWKAESKLTGIYDFLIQKKAAHLETQSAKLWNYEQDLGVEGLRRSKMSYRPVAFLKKYTVSLIA